MARSRSSAARVIKWKSSRRGIPSAAIPISCDSRCRNHISAGGDPAEILGVKTHIETDDQDDDSRPVTVGMLRDIQKQDAHKTAIQRAEEIEDEATRTTVKNYLSNNVKPSGDAEADFKFALSAASAEKNKQVIAEIQRYVAPKRTASGGSMTAAIEEQFTPTDQESVMMRPPYNVSKEKIIEARKRTAERQQ